MKKVIFGLFIATTGTHAGMLTCTTYSYGAYYYIVGNYGSNPGQTIVSSTGSGRGMHLASTYLSGKNSTYGRNIEYSLTNTSPANLYGELYVQQCYNSASSSSEQCFTSTAGVGDTHLIGKVMVPVRQTISGTYSIGNNYQKMSIRLIYVPYIADTIPGVPYEPSYISGTIKWSETYNLPQYIVNYIATIYPNPISSQSIDFPSQVYNSSLENGANSAFSIYNNTNTRYKLKVKSTSGDDVRLRIQTGLAIIDLENGSEQEIDDDNIGVSLYLSDDARPGDKVANIEASWVCP